MKKVFGYVTSRPFGQFVMPVPAQNSCLREYCRNIDGQYVLPRLEHKFINCFMQLFSIGKEARSGHIIAMYSLEIILGNEKALKFVEEKLDSGVEFHFVLENLHLAGSGSMKKLLQYRVFAFKPINKDTLNQYILEYNRGTNRDL